MSSRNYDVVVWGATGTRNCLCTETAPVLPASRVLYIRAGFVGKLVCEYPVKDYRVRWPDVPRSHSALILAMLSDLMVKDTHAGQDSMGNGCSQPAEAGYCPARALQTAPIRTGSCAEEHLQNVGHTAG